MEKQGAEVTFLDDDNFEEHIKENTKAVVFQHASNVTEM
jgi:selenocysteine lyase/cysteine desulfurase